MRLVLTVSYCVSVGPDSLLKCGGKSLDLLVFMDTQLDAEDSAVCPLSWTLETQICFNPNVLHESLISFTIKFMKLKMLLLLQFLIVIGHVNCLRGRCKPSIQRLLHCIWGHRFIAEVWWKISGPVTLKRLTVGCCRLCSVLLFIHLLE